MRAPQMQARKFEHHKRKSPNDIHEERAKHRKTKQSESSKMLSFLQTNISSGSLVARFDSAAGVEVHAKIAKKTKAKATKKKSTQPKPKKLKTEESAKSE